MFKYNNLKTGGAQGYNTVSAQQINNSHTSSFDQARNNNFAYQTHNHQMYNALGSSNGLQKYQMEAQNYHLRDENMKLKDEIAYLSYNTQYNNGAGENLPPQSTQADIEIIDRLRRENRKLKDTIAQKDNTINKYKFDTNKYQETIEMLQLDIGKPI